MPTTHPQDEMLDLVDEHDVVIGNKRRSEVYAEGLHNFRVINAFVKNSRGELWVPRRTATKRIFPLALDVSVGGHVESGETYQQALERETKEELNLNIADVPYHLLGHLTPLRDNVSAHMNVYEIQSDQTPTYNPDDFMEFFWLTPRDLLAKILNGDRSKDDLPKLVRSFYQ